jgi:hypothetical protein
MSTPVVLLVLLQGVLLTVTGSFVFVRSLSGVPGASMLGLIGATLMYLGMMSSIVAAVLLFR